jgi:hypothetical protein
MWADLWLCGVAVFADQARRDGSSSDDLQVGEVGRVPGRQCLKSPSLSSGRPAEAVDCADRRRTNKRGDRHDRSAPPSKNRYWHYRRVPLSCECSARQGYLPFWRRIFAEQQLVDDPRIFTGRSGAGRLQQQQMGAARADAGRRQGPGPRQHPSQLRAPGHHRTPLAYDPAGNPIVPVGGLAIPRNAALEEIGNFILFAQCRTRPPCRFAGSTTRGIIEHPGALRDEWSRARTRRVRRRGRHRPDGPDGHSGGGGDPEQAG